MAFVASHPCVGSTAQARRAVSRRGPAVSLPARRPRARFSMCEQPADANAGARQASEAMAFSTAASSKSSLKEALADVASRALARLSPGSMPDLAVVYVSVRYAQSRSMVHVVPKLRALLPDLKAVIGCATDGVIGIGALGDVIEVEDTPGVSLTLARLPGVKMRTVHFMPDDVPSADARQDAWKRILGDAPDGEVPAFMLLSDPGFAQTGGLARVLGGIEFAYSGAAVVGSLASGGHMFATLPRDVLSAESSSAVRESGLVGIALTGDIEVECLVSPCCRPLGPVFEVRKVGGDCTILELELVGRPSTSLSAIGQLRSLLDYATPEEKRLLQSDLQVGIAINQFTDSDGSEDFLIRHVRGLDVDGGGITIGECVRPGHRVRFFVKEQDTARDALDTAMQKYKRAQLADSLVGYSNPPSAAMMFVDSGRGRALFREPNVETAKLAAYAAGVEISGSFGRGQIGPAKSSQSGGGPAVLHNAANIIALIRRRSGINPRKPPSSSPSSKSTDAATDEPADS